MRFSPLVDRIGGEGAEAWAVHEAALRARAAGEDVVVMSIGDPDFDSPAAVIDGCIDALRGGDTHYTSVAGRSRLRRAVARRFAESAPGLEVGETNVAITAGCQNALFVAAQTILGPGDRAIVPEPMYVTYEATLRAGGGEVDPLACPRDRGFVFDPAALEASVRPETRAVVFANPCNPSGTAFDLEELEAIARVVRAHDLWAIADEVYGQVVFEGEHLSIATLPGMAERTATLSSLSKSHAMPGWRVGWAIGPEALIEHMERYALCATYGLPGFVQEGAAIALERELDEPAAMLATLRARRDRAAELLSEAPGVTVIPPRAGMFMLLDVSGVGLDGAAFSRALFEEHRVSALDGGAFGPSARGCIRVSFAIDEAGLEQGCRSIVALARSLSR